MFALSVEGDYTALAAVGTTENACTTDRRKLGCTDGRLAERQRVVEVHQIVSHPHGGERSNAATQSTSTPQALHPFELQAGNAIFSGWVKGRDISF